jgi:hypothetical protein
MKLYLKYFLIAVSIFSFVKCGNYYKSLLKDNSKLVAGQYSLLVQESDKFLIQPKQKDFIKDLNNYLLECKEYNFNDGREPTIFLSPAIVDEKYNRAIALVLERGSGISGDRIEFIKFISAKYSNNKWIFKLKKGHGYSFSYANNEIKTSSNEELGKEAIRILMLEGYFKNYMIYDESLFNSDWYTLN